jgi:cobaltochelatase CobT
MGQGAALDLVGLAAETGASPVSPHTDFDAMKKAATTPLEKHVWNIFEDWRVEARLAEIFPGCRQNFRWLICHLFLQPNPAPRPPLYLVLDWLLLSVRSWAVPDLVPVAAGIGLQIDQLWPGLGSRLEVILSAMRAHCPDSIACLDYARQVIRSLSHTPPNPDAAPASAATGPKNDDPTGQQDTVAEGASSANSAGTTDLQALIHATANELPEDLGQLLKRSITGETTKLGRSAVATVGKKHVSSLSGQELLEIQQVTAGMRARLQGLLQATRMVRQMPNRSRGRIDPRRLHGVVTGSNPQIFLTYQRKPAINTAVHILLDSSASMRTRIGLATRCCHAVAQALAQVGISVGITAFPGEQHASVVPLLRHGDRVHSNLLVEAGGGTPLSESLWWVLQRLTSLREERKIVLIITDGCPDNPATVKEAIKAADALGLEIHGLGIDASQILQILPHSSRNIQGIRELPTAIFGMLQQALLHRRRAA